jgi:hypothetical protein
MKLSLTVHWLWCALQQDQTLAVWVLLMVVVAAVQVKENPL